MGGVIETSTFGLPVKEVDPTLLLRLHGKLQKRYWNSRHMLQHLETNWLSTPTTANDSITENDLSS